MRYIIALLLCAQVLLLGACGDEKSDLTPPSFGETITAVGSSGSVDLLSRPSQDEIITISGTIDDPTAMIEVVVNTTAVIDNLTNDGVNWSFKLINLAERLNVVTLSASDKRGNSNKLYLYLKHDTIAPTVIASVPAKNSTVTEEVSSITIIFSETLTDAMPVASDFLIDNIPVVDTAFTYDTTTHIATLLIDPPLSDGIHTVTINSDGTIEDRAGNIMGTETVTFTVAIPVLP